MKNFLMMLIPVVYPLILFGIAIFLFKLNIARRERDNRERSPLEEGQKLLRGPGESQRRQLEKLDESFLLVLVRTMILAFVLPGIPIQLLSWLKITDPNKIVALVALAVVLFLVGSAYSIILFLKAVDERRKVYLGYFGERVIGDVLDPLKQQRFYVFHDLPIKDSKSPCNIDHVVVGSTGLFVIETKTYRKREGRNPLESHEIIFDKNRLIFPWGESRDELRQATDHADWLTDRMKQMTGQRFHIQPVLVFPGWFVKSDGELPWVLNHKNLTRFISTRRGNELDAGQIDLIARQFAALCRDVEFGT